MHHGMGSNIDGIFVSRVKGIEHMCKLVIEEGNAKMHGEIRVRLRGKEQGGEEEGLQLPQCRQSTELLEV